MIYITGLFALALLGLLLWRILRLQRDQHIVQYLFFLRVPIIGGVALLIVPLLPLGGLDNLFQPDPWGAGVVLLTGCLAAWAVAYVWRLTCVSIPNRNQLLLSKSHQSEWSQAHDDAERKTPYVAPQLDPDQQRAPVLWGSGRLINQEGRLFTTAALSRALLLAGPLAGRLIYSASEAGTLLGTVAGCAVGVMFAYLMLAAHGGLRRWLDGIRDRPMDFARKSALKSWVGGVYGMMPVGIQVFHLRAAAFFALTMLGYGLLFFFGNPAWFPEASSHIPAISYLLLLAMLSVWGFGGLAFLSDPLRVPVAGLVLGGLAVWHAVWPNHHTFVVKEWSAAAPPQIKDVVLKRASRSDRPVIIAASGGGLTASLWTAQVLAGLEKEIEGFSKNVVLLSTVSGGGVGAMMYVNAFGEDGRVSGERVAGLADRAGRSCLSSSVWGLAYLDLARSVLGQSLGRFDRGWALEQRFQALMGANPTLEDWSQGVVEGWRPVQLFNVTVQETGQRLVLGPAVFPRHTAGTRRDIGSFLRPSDEESFMLVNVDVTTAARLSATFPYVSPQTRPSKGVPRYHLCDGGYYDNSGLETALDVIKAITGRGGLGPQEGEPEKDVDIVLIEIRAYPDLSSAFEFRSNGGIGELDPGYVGLPEPESSSVIAGIYGPIQTLNRVRSMSFPRIQEEIYVEAVRLARERTRGDVEMDESGIGKQSIGKGVSLKHFVFQLPDRLPLSWHLSPQEVAAIRSHWPDHGEQPDDDFGRWIRSKNASALNDLTDLMTRGE